MNRDFWGWSRNEIGKVKSGDSPRPKVEGKSKSKINSMLVTFEVLCIRNFCFKDTKSNLLRCDSWQCPENGHPCSTRNCWLLDHDNGPCHTVLLRSVHEYLASSPLLNRSIFAHTIIFCSQHSKANSGTGTFGRAENIQEIVSDKGTDKWRFSALFQYIGTYSVIVWLPKETTFKETTLFCSYCINNNFNYWSHYYLDKPCMSVCWQFFATNK